MASASSSILGLGVAVNLNSPLAAVSVTASVLELSAATEAILAKLKSGTASKVSFGNGAGLGAAELTESHSQQFNSYPKLEWFFEFTLHCLQEWG